MRKKNPKNRCVPTEQRIITHLCAALRAAFAPIQKQIRRLQVAVHDLRSQTAYGAQRQHAALGCSKAPLALFFVL